MSDPERKADAEMWLGALERCQQPSAIDRVRQEVARTREEAKGLIGDAHAMVLAIGFVRIDDILRKS